MALPPGIVFRELPFCGVFVDLGGCEVFRVPRPAAAVVRVALDGRRGVGPYDELVGDAAVDPASAGAVRLLDRLVERGLLRPVTP